METKEILEQLHDLGVSVQMNGPNVRLEPKSKVPDVLLDQVREHKPEIIQYLRRNEQRVGDGRLPPLDRPPQTREELCRLIDHLDDPHAFADWFESLMRRSDPTEDPH